MEIRTACAWSNARVATLVGRLSGKRGNCRRSFKQHSALVAAVAITATFGFVVPASAQEFSGVLQNIVDMLTGDTARLLAVLGVIITGFLWIFGYLDLRRAAIVVAGIVVLFSAEEIVTMITGA